MFNDVQNKYITHGAEKHPHLREKAFENRRD